MRRIGGIVPNARGGRTGIPGRRPARHAAPAGPAARPPGKGGAAAHSLGAPPGTPRRSCDDRHMQGPGMCYSRIATTGPICMGSAGVS